VPPKPVFTMWMGETGAASEAFEAANIPNYITESAAVYGFMHLVHYREARELLMATPPNLPTDFAPDPTVVRQVIDSVLRDSRTWLDPIELTRVLSAYAIPITPAVLARDAEQAVAAAKPHLAKGVPVVLKIQSPDIVHKSEVGGVRLDLASEAAVREAATDIFRRARAAKPDARIAGVTVFPMIVRPKARELIVGVADDPTFGPVIAFGQGGTAVEVISDKALALPPLNLDLAKRLIARTRVSRILKAYRNVPAADERAIELLLVKLSQLVADFPEIREIDLNPVLADETGVIAVDARISVAPIGAARRGAFGNPRFAIRPYPTEWVRQMRLGDGKAIVVRPVKPEDEPLYGPFFAAVTAADLRLRFFAPIKDFSHAFVARLTQIDYARAMAFVAIDEATGALLGVVRLHADANYVSGEYAILVRSDLKGQGLGWQLMQLMIDYARSEGIHTVKGQVLRENTTMLDMCREFGFHVETDPQEPTSVVVTLQLSA
jgi:acetyltransferase